MEKKTQQNTAAATLTGSGGQVKKKKAVGE